MQYLLALLVLALPFSAWAQATHTVVVGMAEDFFMGDAAYSISIDGKTPVTGTVTVLQSSGNTQDLTLAPLTDPGAHTVQISYTNDLYGGSPSADRNFYLHYVKYDGVIVANSSANLYSNGTVSVTVGPATWPDPFASPGTGAIEVQFSANGWDCDAGQLPSAATGCQPAAFVGQKFWLSCIAGRNDCISSPTAFLGYSTSGGPIRGQGFCYIGQPNTCRP